MKITGTDEAPRDATKGEQHKSHEPPFGACYDVWPSISSRAPDRGVLSLRLSGRVGVLPPLLAGRRELELTVGEQLAARYQPYLLTGTTCWAGPVRTLTRAAPYARSSLDGWKQFV